jgi:hypothetical protein
MRRFATLAAAGAMTLLPSAPAFAGTGWLQLSGAQPAFNPSGCYDSPLWPLGLTNHTNESVLVFKGADCTGEAVGVVARDKSGTFEFGRSVYVP